MSTFRSAWFRTVVTVIAVTSPAMARLSAHPTATSFVTIGLPAPGVVSVAVTTDAESLLLKLQALAAVTPIERPSAALTDQRIKELGATLAAHIELNADGQPLALTLADLVRVPDTPGRIRVTLTGLAPAHAKLLRWRTSLFFGAYPLAVRTGPASDPVPAEAYEWLNGTELSQPHNLSGPDVDSVWSRMGRLILLGFTHIVPGGLDHVLFVLGLFLLARNARALLLQISAFTVAHSLTLGLAMAGWVSVPARVVEPLIAASIAYIAVENLMRTSLSRWRLAVVFVFGLLHGLGFASALADLGLTSAHYAATLAGFNIGVELGQLAVVLSAALLVRTLPLSPEMYRRVLVRPASAAIAAVGLFWAAQRVFF